MDMPEAAEPAMAGSANDELRPAPLPPGEYAIVEQLGHRTMVGRIAEVERFGVKMMSIEPLLRGELLPAVFVGGPSLYAITPCSADAASRRGAQDEWHLPASVRATLAPLALAGPDDDIVRADEAYESDEPVFAPAFLGR